MSSRRVTSAVLTRGRRMGNRVCACHPIHRPGAAGAPCRWQSSGKTWIPGPAISSMASQAARCNPIPKAVYTVKATDTTGFSISYDVEDESASNGA